MAYTITRELSDKVVSIIHNITGEIVNIMVEGGRILSSSDPARIGTVHEGGARIMNREVSEIAITHEMAGTVKGAKPGYNGGIYYRNRLIGCLGIGGDPDVVKPLQKMATVIVNETIARKNRVWRKKNCETRPFPGSTILPRT